MEVYTVAFFGHRDFNHHFKCEKALEKILRDLIKQKEYVEFLVGRNGEFDQFVASVVRRMKKEYDNSNSALVWVLPYVTAEYTKQQKMYKAYYDEIEVCEKSAVAHYKSAIQIRNHAIVDRANMIICYVERNQGGAYQAIRYAKKQGKRIINLAIDEESI